MKRASPTGDDALAPFERFPSDFARLLLEKYCCTTGDTKRNNTLIRVIASLSRRMLSVIKTAFPFGQCARLACRVTIWPYEEYYTLGGGKVVNCARCACDVTYTIKVGKDDVTFKRGWDETAKSVWWTKLKRIMI